MLAGGHATRFGSDKAMAVLNGRPLIDHVIAALAAYTDMVVVCGRPWAEGLALPDRPRADLGPLGGLNAALHYAANQGYGWVITAGCDTPMLPAQLFEQLGSQHTSAIIADMPIIGRWSAGLASALDHHLMTAEDRSIRRFARSVGAQLIPFASPIVNVNTTKDLQAIGGG